jgi:riboflavin kinase/FMN adenylyltransferase
LEVYRGLETYPAKGKAIVTVGTFDGVHIGHQKILSRISEIAQKESGNSVLLTFHPHPRLVLFPEDNDLKLLSTLEERIALLEAAGLDHLIVQPFSIDFSRMSAVEYVRDILVKSIGVYKLVIGYDHHFGRNREGNLARLTELAPTYGFGVEEISAQDIDEVNVSSTKIRNALEAGKIKTANQYLGYHYSLSGVVVKGEMIGRSIGFPTANVNCSDRFKLIPGHGVYLCKVLVRDQWHRAMVNIGSRPTLKESADLTIEAHLFNFTGDLYGQEVKVEFLDRLRDEVRFEGLDELKKQLEKDAEMANNLFSDKSL